MAANSRFAVATHIMTSLATKPDELVSSSYLASSLNTNPVVVRRTLGDLQRAGLLRTQHGRTGGAELAKSPTQITLFDIYAAVDEGDLFAYNPNKPNQHCPLSCKMKMILEPVFLAAAQSLEEKLRSTRLSDLVARFAQMSAETENNDSKVKKKTKRS